jgi:hypothetical protein
LASECPQEPFDSGLIPCHDWAVIRVTCYKYIRSIEETLIVLALGQADCQKAVSKVFEPQMGRNRQSVQTLDKAETYHLLSRIESHGADESKLDP